jgi:hypothetical protein
LIRDLECVDWVVGRDGRLRVLEPEAVRGWAVVDMAAMSRYERSTKLLEHTALASHVFGIRVDKTRVVEMTSAVSTKWDLGSRFNLDLVLHVAKRCMSCVPQTNRHVG